jgi:Icc-related predicted phosphoesterase
MLPSPTGLSRRKFLAVTGLAGGSFLFPPPVQAAPSQLRILFYTDIHASLQDKSPAALKLAADKINSIEADLILCGGDVIHGGFNSDPATATERYDAYLRFRERLKGRVEHLMGNHDLVAVAPKEGVTPSEDPEALFREKIGVKQLFRSFDIGGVHFILLQSVERTGDASRYRGHIPPEQITWLQKDLAQVSASTPIVLASHIPLRTTFKQVQEGSTAALPPNLVVVNALDVLSLFKNHNLRLVLHGHLHVNEWIRFNSLDFIMGGAVCGKWWGGPNLGTPEGFGLATLGKTGTDWSYMDYGWSGKSEDAVFIYKPKEDS